MGILSTMAFPIYRFVVVSVAADPPFIEIGYNETVNIELGMINLNTGEFQKVKQILYWDTRFINFEVVEYPGGTDSTSWFIDFDPYTIKVEKDTLLKTNVTISLTSPPVASNAIQSGLLKFRILDTWGYGDLWFPQKGDPTWDKLGMRFMWFFSAAFILKYGKYSGTVELQKKDISVLVKVKPYHAIKIDTVPLINLKPNQLASIPISLENLGNYNDTYSFRIVSDIKDIVISNPSSITLAPGEQKDIYLGISVPQSAFDYGTLHSLNIEAYSIYDPNVTINKETIYFETRGIYLSEISGIGILFFSIIVIIVIVIFLRRRRMFFEKYCVKPDKPWKIDEEKSYLDEIKKTDEQKYKEILKMMHEEYNSSLLWYKHYIDAAIKKDKEVKIEKKIKKETEKLKIIKEPKKEKIPKIFKTKEKEIPIIEKKESPVLKKKELPISEKKEETPIKVDLEAMEYKLRKEQIIKKIKREQEQQIKKLGSGD